MEKIFTIGELTALNPGSILSFDLPSKTPAGLNVNGKTVATGTVVQIADNFGLQIDKVLG